MNISKHDRKIFAENLLNNPLFCATIEKIKKNAINSMKNAPWNAEGDSLRRREMLRIELIEELRKQFEAISVSSQGSDKNDKQESK